MSIFKKILGGKQKPIKSYSDFWDWFKKHEKKFHSVVKNGNDIDGNFFSKLEPMLEQLHDGFHFLTGMMNKKTAELIITPDGEIKNIVFIEELIQAAPELENWKFTALKPASKDGNFVTKMSGYEFDSDSMHFFPENDSKYPDEINLIVTHNKYTESNKEDITLGVHIFLENFLGELYYATFIDSVKVRSPKEIKGELIPLTKLKDYLKWREKEFIDNYGDKFYLEEDDEHQLLTATTKDGSPIIAVVNAELLNWEAKTSHPWISYLEISFNSSDESGLPDEQTMKKLDLLEDEILEKLTPKKGHLFVSRETTKNLRKIYLASKDFRLPSKILTQLIINQEDDLDISFDIFKDKYWQSFEKYRIY